MNAIMTTSPDREHCDADHHSIHLSIAASTSYLLTWTGKAENVQRWHPACFRASGITATWVRMPAAFVDTVRVGVVG